jgi:hypothetical protein
MNIMVVSPQAVLIVTNLLGMSSACQLLARVPYLALGMLLVHYIFVSLKYCMKNEQLLILTFDVIFLL